MNSSTLLRERHDRSRHFPVEFTQGCPWAMLLELHAHPCQRISSICYGSGHPYTTALKHLSRLTEAGLVERSPCADGRGAVCSLTDTATRAMNAYLESIRRPQESETPEQKRRRLIGELAALEAQT